MKINYKKIYFLLQKIIISLECVSPLYRKNFLLNETYKKYTFYFKKLQSDFNY